MDSEAEVEVCGDRVMEVLRVELGWDLEKGQRDRFDSQTDASLHGKGRKDR